MPFEKCGNGYLGKFDETKGTNRPAYKGKIFLKQPDGTEKQLDLGAWVKEKEDGTKYFSISVSRIVEDEQSQTQAAPPPTDDEIPF